MIEAMEPAVRVKIEVPTEAPPHAVPFGPEPPQIVLVDVVGYEIAVVADAKAHVVGSEKGAKLRNGKPTVVINQAVNVRGLASQDRGARREGPTADRTALREPRRMPKKGSEQRGRIAVVSEDRQIGAQAISDDKDDIEVAHRRLGSSRKHGGDVHVAGHRSRAFNESGFHDATPPATMAQRLSAGLTHRERIREMIVRPMALPPPFPN